jgi:phospho-N-acetylmuramoyl-pentapeptide-transferase
MRPLLVFVAALVVSALVFPAAIGQLARARMGQQIREEGPAAHHGKAGTPTAGGLVFVLVALVLYLVADRSVAGGFVLIALAFGAALGFLDDFSAIRGGRSLGLKARQKIVIQLATGALLGYLALRWGLTSQLVPFDGRHPISGWIMIVVTALAVAAGSNAFNLTDGSDGLAAGAGAITFGALAIIACCNIGPAPVSCRPSWRASLPVSCSTTCFPHASSWVTPGASRWARPWSRPRSPPASSGICHCWRSSSLWRPSP